MIFPDYNHKELHSYNNSEHLLERDAHQEWTICNQKRAENCKFINQVGFCFYSYIPSPAIVKQFPCQLSITFYNAKMTTR